MSLGSAVQAPPGWEDAGQADSASGGGEEIDGFLAAFSTMLQESIARFELTAARITDMIMTRPGTTDRELVMTLQEFDRLQQEFSALGGVLERFAAHTNNASPDSPPAGRVDTAISGIALSEVKERFADHFVRMTADPPETFEEVVF